VAVFPTAATSMTGFDGEGLGGARSTAQVGWSATLKPQSACIGHDVARRAATCARRRHNGWQWWRRWWGEVSVMLCSPFSSSCHERVP
jgi:hypothetical protein